MPGKIYMDKIYSHKIYQTKYTGHNIPDKIYGQNT